MGKIVNKLSYMLSYLIQGLFSATMGTYLPVYLKDTLSIDSFALSIISFLAYLPLVFKPILAILGDNLPIKGYKRKYYVVIGTASFILLTVLIGVLPTEPLIIVFTILLSLAYLSVALFDANLDGLMVDSLIRSKSRVPTVVLFMIFLQVGNIIASILFGIFSEIESLNEYLFLFLCCAIVTGFLHLVSYKLVENESIPAEKVEELPENTNHKHNQNLTSVFVASSIVFALFLNGDKMSDWLLEPYITDTFSGGGFDAFLVYNDWISIFSTLQIIGYLIALFLPEKNDPYSERSQKLLVVLLVIFAIQWIIFPFLSLKGLIIMTSIVVIIGGMAYIQFIDIFMMIAQNLKTRQKSTVYQVYLLLFTLGSIIARPVGTLLSNWIPANIVLILCSIPMFISAAALYMVHREIKKSK